MTTDNDWLAEQFDQHRTHLRAVAYRMLGSRAEAEDAVQEAWLRLSRTDADAIENLGGWLTTVVARVSLNMLRSRATRRETELGDVHAPEVLIDRADGVDPEHEALLADSVGLALLVVLETLSPAERLAFVLHDVFGVPFGEISRILERSQDATRQLASRARRRVRDARRAPDADLARQRAAVDAFQTAARAGDFEALLEVLDPDVVLRNAGPRAVAIVRGSHTVSTGARAFQRLGYLPRPVLVDGVPGLASYDQGRLVGLAAFTVVGGRIVEIDVLSDPARLAALGLSG